MSKTYAERAYTLARCLICDESFFCSRADASFCSPRCRKVFSRRRKAGHATLTTKGGAPPTPKARYVKRSPYWNQFQTGER